LAPAETRRPHAAPRRTERLAADADGLARASELLRAGGIVAFPTETVYGLGALALDPLAVRGIYAAKGRPSTNPLIVHVDSVEAARKLSREWPASADRLAAQYWPGPLTLILPKRDEVPDEVTGGGATVGLRVPAHPVALALLRAVGMPLAAPSANLSEHVSPTTVEHVLADLEGRIDAVLDGGECSVGIESTVLTLAEPTPRILRPGGLPRAELELCLPSLAAPMSPQAETPLAPLASPGLLARHYAPAGHVVMTERSRLADTSRTLAAPRGVLFVGSPDPLVSWETFLTLERDPQLYQKALYAALRELEARGAESILIEEPPRAPAWEAVRDRLARAATRER
jgi:L-threonylcarbamoyladenylate synthase